VLLLVLVGVFLGLRLVSLTRPTPAPTAFPRPVVVVGVTARSALTATDRTVLAEHPRDTQLAAVSVRPRYIGDCAAAGWTTLGAGRRAAVGGRCDPRVVGGRVVDWAERVRAAAAHHGDARLGTLAESVRGCTAAVGPGAALAAARPDGTLARYQSVAEFVAAGMATPCPVTLVDAGDDSDRVLAVLAARAGTTVVLTGIGPAAGSADPALQLLYAIPATPGGWLTSASTRRRGVVGLTDLTRSLIDDPAGTAAVDGTEFRVFPGPVTAADAAAQLRSVSALSRAVLRADLVLGTVGAVLVLLAAASALRQRWALPRAVLALVAVLPAAMMLTGAVPWSSSAHPVALVLLALAGWAGLLTALARLSAQRLRVPVAVAGAALTFAAFTVDAALGAVMEPGSMLNSRPVNGGRWYGFGNVTFAVYAAATLVLAGHLAGRLRQQGQPRSAVAAVAAVGLTAVVCDGWPSMGADFGGVLALTPAVLWLLLALTGVRVSGQRLLLIGAGTVLAVSAISWLDWRRGPSGRSHLGDFVQRVIEGDAQDIVLRKAVAAAESLLSPAGLATVALAAAAWVLVFTRLLPRLTPRTPSMRPTALAAVAVAVLGTLLNDGGVSVLLTLTASFALLATGLVVEQPDG
jgi:hypothetical protein